MIRRIIAMLLAVLLLTGILDTKISAAEGGNTGSLDITKCVLYAQQDTDAITINAGIYLSMEILFQEEILIL